MTIPPTMSAAWAVAGIRPADRPKIFAMPENAIRFVADVEKTFNLPAGILGYKSKETGKPMKKYGKVCLSDVRKAMLLRLNEETKNPICHLGQLINLDRSAGFKALRDAKIYREQGNPAFMAVYETVKQIPFE